jgi:hypothetical protein
MYLSNAEKSSENFMWTERQSRRETKNKLTAPFSNAGREQKINCISFISKAISVAKICKFLKLLKN